jgi:hypothetical protein
MPRPAWSLFAYQLIEPDEQLDLFACQEVRVHLVARQLELGGSADRTLCGSLLPAQPRWSSVDRRVTRTSACARCAGPFSSRSARHAPIWPELRFELFIIESQLRRLPLTGRCTIVLYPVDLRRIYRMLPRFPAVTRCLSLPPCCVAGPVAALELPCHRPVKTSSARCR